MFTHLIGSGGPTFQSDFEDQVMALNPTAVYLFRDADWSSSILDSSGNDYHLSKVYATATRGDQLRSTHPGGLVLPSYSTWGTDNVVYSRAATTGLDVDLGGATSVSTLVGIKIVTLPTVDDYRVFGVGTYNGSASGSNDMHAMLVKTIPQVEFKERHSTGLSGLQDDSPSSDAQIYSCLFDYFGAPEGLLDAATAAADVQKDTASFSGSAFDDIDRVTHIGGRNNTGIDSQNGVIIIDHISVWTPALSIAQMDTLRAAYRSEIIS